MKPNIYFCDEPLLSKKRFQEVCNITIISGSADVVYVKHTSPDFECFPNLKVVICPCTGVGHLDVPKNVKLIYLNDKEYLYNFVHATAEYTVLAMMDLLRCNHEELYTKRVGLIGGAGRIGRQVIDKLYGLTKTLPIVYDIFKVPKPQRLKCIQVDSIVELYKQCDIVSVHLPETDSNKEFINNLSFEAMKACNVEYFINTSRSSIVSCEGLIEHFKDFKGICLDVTESYASDQLVNLGYLGMTSGTYFLNTPHIAGNTKQSRLATDAYVLTELGKWIKGNFGGHIIYWRGEKHNISNHTMRVLDSLFKGGE